MTDNPRTAYKEGDDRFYDWPKRGTYPSVTTILSRLPARWLADWYARVIAEDAVHFISVCLDQAETDYHSALERLIAGEELGAFKIDRMMFNDHDKAVNNLKYLPAKRRDDAAAIGTMAHSAIHKYLEHGEKPDMLDSGYVEAAENFLNDKNIQPRRFELELVNFDLGYAGTVDLIGRDKNGIAVAVDWKSGKRIYPKHAAQICALMRCTHYLTPEMGTGDLPKIERGFIVQITEDGKYRPYELNMAHADLFIELMSALKVVMAFSKLKSADLWSDIGAWQS